MDGASGRWDYDVAVIGGGPGGSSAATALVRRGRIVWRAWTRAGDPVQVAGVWWWRRRLAAGIALAWVTPVSGARCLALAAYIRALPGSQVQELLAGLPRDRYDRLLEAAYPPQGTAA